jgi:uncharacterized phage infection (PIP) family protein YhgE
MAGTDEILPPTPIPGSVQEPNASDPPSDIEQGNDLDSGSNHGNIDDIVDEMGYLLQNLKTETRNNKNERNTLKARIAELEESSRLVQAQLRQAEEQLQTAETDHASSTERLSRQVSEAEQRAAAAETEVRLVCEGLQSLQDRFADTIGDALTSAPAGPQKYRMTTSRPARGPDRNIHREFKPEMGCGSFCHVSWQCHLAPDLVASSKLTS